MPSPQKSGDWQPVWPQHICPAALPHATQTFLSQVVNPAVQPTSPAQHAWPSLPHWPF
jgi:hypothetical protein